MLSKSNYINGLQCLKYLWTIFHEPLNVPEPGRATQYVFDQGHLVGKLARQLYPDGIELPEDNFKENLRRTERLLVEHDRPLFEAGILSDNLYSRIDILRPSNGKDWDIVEVKSTTVVKEVHHQDLAFQRLCLERHGLSIGKCFLIHINNQYVKHGNIAPKDLFVIEDVTPAVEVASLGIQDRVDEMLTVIAAPSCPDIVIGKHCTEPYECPLSDCWGELPEHNIFSLYRGGPKCYELYERGIISIAQIPDDFNMILSQQIQKKCILSNEVYVDTKGIRQFLSSLVYPLYFLDFETVSPAIPLFDNSRPYQAIPFQFSLHKVSSKGAVPEHCSFLARYPDDPRPELLSKLGNNLGSRGSIIVYNKSFEKGVLKELADTFPEHQGWIADAINRIVDLLVPFRKFQYYHPAQEGSTSIKQVLPAITGLSYDALEIAGGQEASVAFQAVTYADADDETKNRVYEQLEQYCGLDTEGMLHIVNRLGDLLNEFRH